MQPTGTIKVHNFMGYKEAELDLSSIRLACVSGENGAGKSSMFVHSWLWALVGREHIDLDDVVGHFGNTAAVQASFTGTNGTIYTVRRARVKGKSTELTVSVDGKSVASGATEAQEFINREILRGCTYRDIVASVVMKQGEHSIFTRATPKEAKEILSRAVGQDVWATHAATAKAMREAANNDLQKALGAVQRLPALSAESLELIESEPEIVAKREAAVLAGAEANRLVETLRVKAEEALAAKNALSMLEGDVRLKADEHYRAQQDHERVKQRIADAERLVAAGCPEDLEALEAQLATLEADRDKSLSWAEKYGPLKSEVDRVNLEVRIHNDALEALAQTNKDILSPTDTSVCPACQRPFGADAGALEAVRSQYEAQRAEIEDDLKANEKALKKLDKEIAALGPEPTYDRVAIDSTRQKISAARAAASTEQDLRNMVNVEEPALLKLEIAARKELDAARKAVDKAEAAMSDTSETEAAYVAAVTTAKEHADSVSYADMMLGRIAALKQQAEQTEEAMGTLQFELDEAEYRVKVYTLAEKAFGRNGIPAYLIDAAIPAIEQAANAILARMSGGKLKVGLVTQADNRDGTQRETLDILISDGVATRKFSTYSGGQGFRINFALRVALARTIADRSGLGLSMLVIDEPEGLDAAGRQSLIECISSIEDTFETVILVSHHEDLRDALPDKIFVSFDDVTGSALHLAAG